MDNITRINLAETAIIAFIGEVEGAGQNHEEDIIDLITNLFHYANSVGLNPHSISRMAMIHYIAESVK